MMNRAMRDFRSLENERLKVRVTTLESERGNKWIVPLVVVSAVVLTVVPILVSYLLSPAFVMMGFRISVLLPNAVAVGFIVWSLVKNYKLSRN